MKHFLPTGFCLILSASLIGCSQPSENNTDKEEYVDNLDQKVNQNTDSSLALDEKYAFENLRIEFAEAIALNSTSNIAIPLIYDETERDKMDYARTFFNVAVLTEASEKPVMIFDSPVMINEISTLEPRKTSLEKYYGDDYYDSEEDERPTFQKTAFDGLLFLETTMTYGNDSRLDNLWIYDLKNLTLVQINPEFTDVMDWKAMENSDRIILNYITDSNGDKLLNDDDDRNMSIYDVTTKSNSGPLFDIEMLKDMKSQVVKSH